MTRNSRIKLDDALDEYVEFIDADRYAMNMRTMYGKAEPFLKDRGVRTIDEIEVRDCREFAKHLARKVEEGELKASSVETTYAQFRSWLSFCVRDEMIDDNPAKKRRAEEVLPDVKREKSQQFWSPEDREAIIDAVDDVAEDALPEELEEPGLPLTFRNRAATYVLSFTGTRICEILANPNDTERNGIRWRDVDLEGGTIRVFGKNREYEHMQLPSAPAAVLDEYKQIVKPDSGDWPVFPTGCNSKLYSAAREQLADRGHVEDEREALLEEREILDVYREEGLVPPALTAAGFKTGFWFDFVDEHDLHIDGERPEFHAARRGLGDELYREDPRLAQSALRHNDLRTTHKSYSDIQAGETADEVDETIDIDDPPGFLEDENDGEPGESD